MSEVGKFVAIVIEGNAGKLILKITRENKRADGCEIRWICGKD